MKAFHLASIALLLSPLTSVGPRADELKRERLPADVDFVLHLDLEGLMRTELWRMVQESADGEFKIDDIDAELGDFRTRFGIDPLTDVKAVTLYKFKSEEDPTVCLISTTSKIDLALTVAQKEPSYAKVSARGIELHTWRHEDDGQDETMCAYLHVLKNGERLVVLSSNKDCALRAARVLRGEQPNQTSGAAVLEVNPNPGSFLYFAAANLAQLDEFSPASEVFGLAQGIQVDLGEAGGFLNAHMSVLTDSPENARNISDVAQGLIALGSLAGSELGPVLELLRALRINISGSLVRVDFSFGVRRLVEILQFIDDESHEDHGDDWDDDGDDDDDDEENEPR